MNSTKLCSRNGTLWHNSGGTGTKTLRITSHYMFIHLFHKSLSPQTLPTHWMRDCSMVFKFYFFPVILLTAHETKQAAITSQ